MVTIMASAPPPPPAPPADPVLEGVHLTYVYPDGTEALRDVSLAVPRGRRVAVLGANGCGKSTLFLHLNGILRPASGELRLAGERVRYDRALRRRVGLVFQDPDSQLFTANVHEDISFGPLNLGWGAPEVRQRVEQAIRDTQIEDLVDRPTHLLSYGQKKRVAIAGVLAMEPEVIVADEPTAGLDPEMSARLMELLDRLRDLGRTVLISTHDVELALAWADHVIVLREGRVVGTGEPGEVFRNADLLRQARLLPPIVLAVYAQLQERGVLPPLPHHRAPRTAAQLVDAIAFHVGGDDGDASQLETAAAALAAGG